MLPFPKTKERRNSHMGQAESHSAAQSDLQRLNDRLPILDMTLPKDIAIPRMLTDAIQKTQITGLTSASYPAVTAWRPQHLRLSTVYQTGKKINEKFTLKKEGYAKIKKEQRRLQNESGRPEARLGGSGNFLSCALLSMGLYRTGSPVLSRFAPLSKSWRLRSQNSASVCGNACFFLESMVR